jgi:hypothetical protein
MPAQVLEPTAHYLEERKPVTNSQKVSGLVYYLCKVTMELTFENQCMAVSITRSTAE